MADEKIKAGEEKAGKKAAKNDKNVKKKPEGSRAFSRISGALRRDKKPKIAKEATIMLTKPGRDAYDVLRFVLMTEKAVRQIELQNRLVFIVDRHAKKNEIRSAAETAFNSPIRNVTTMIDQLGRKKAFVVFENEGAAGEIAVRLGII
jgi:large subunit ribosomal protein L23